VYTGGVAFHDYIPVVVQLQAVLVFYMFGNVQKVATDIVGFETSAEQAQTNNRCVAMPRHFRQAFKQAFPHIVAVSCRIWYRTCSVCPDAQLVFGPS
jgi:hypothetical protein